MGNFTHIKLTDKGKKDLTFLAKKNGHTQIEYASRAFTYLKKTGLDIFEDDMVDIPGLIKGLDRRLVGFLKQREKDFFIPMDKALNEQISLFKQVMFGLENFDIVSFRTEKKPISDQQTKPSLKAPKSSLPEQVSTNDEDNGSINRTSEHGAEDDNEVLDRDSIKKLQIEAERYKRQSEDYRKELEFFLENIVQGGGLNSGKFIFKGIQNDLKRVRAKIR